MNDLISIVIPFHTYKPGVLERAVRSVSIQTHKNHEIIVVDDCSPISVEKEVHAYPSVRVIKLSRNVGGAEARNIGVECARGKFIAFLDCDDEWLPTKLSQQLELYLSTACKYSHVVVYSRCEIVEGSRNFIRPIREIGSGESVGDYLFASSQIIQTSGIFLSKSVAERVRFQDIPRHQDYQFCLDLERYGCKFIMLNQVSYLFHQTPKLNNYRYSEMWLRQYSDRLSWKAQRGFKRLVVLRSMISAKNYVVAFKYAVNERLVFTFFDILSRLSVKRALKVLIWR